MEDKEKNYLFLILANVLSILFLLVIIASIWAESQPMAQGASMVLIAFSFPVLIGGSFLMMIIAKIRDEKPLWAYLSVIILPAIDVLIFAGAEKQDMMPAVLFLSIVTGAGAVSYGIGCFIKRYFVKENGPIKRLHNENYTVPNNSKSRFIIKSAKFISVINCFLTLILLNVEFGDVVISLLGILTIISLILLLTSRLKSEQPSFIDFLIANASLFTSLFASAYFSEWLMFWIIILVLFIIEPVIWILFKNKIKIWLSIIILAITLTGVCYIIYSIIEYSENKSREQTEERYRKWDLEYLQNMKLEGNWVMILPAGYKINVPIKYLGDFKFKIEGKIFDAEYEKHFLKYFEDKHSSIEWQIVDKDSLLLKDYHCSGLVMVRGEKLLKMKDVPELKLSGSWVEISPGYFKKNSTIAYLEYLKYKIDGKIFDVDFNEGVLTNREDKNYPVYWKIVDNDSLQLINNKSK
ncbi:MAG: hypothetical protein PHF33_04820 [Candidatus Delongbacteria bacterium]|nr:hypothetical protein [Candidatus Delongbacteria bacterium]